MKIIEKFFNDLHEQNLEDIENEIYDSIQENAIDPELIEILEKEILNQEEFDFVSEHEQVVELEDCGNSGRYPEKTWFVAKLVNGDEYSIY